jgi:hypothetical protein
MLKNSYKLYKYKVNNQIPYSSFIITNKTIIKSINNKPITLNSSDISLFNHFNLNSYKYFISS